MSKSTPIPTDRLAAQLNISLVAAVSKLDLIQQRLDEILGSLVAIRSAVKDDAAQS